MSLSYWIITIVSILVIAILIEIWLKRNKPRRSLHERFGAVEPQDEDTPLGMEALDIENFQRANKLNDNLSQQNGSRDILGTKPHAATKTKKP